VLESQLTMVDFYAAKWALTVADSLGLFVRSRDIGQRGILGGGSWGVGYGKMIDAFDVGETLKNVKFEARCLSQGGASVHQIAALQDDRQ
jgi:hypothetical protein